MHERRVDAVTCRREWATYWSCNRNLRELSCAHAARLTNTEKRKKRQMIFSRSLGVLVEERVWASLLLAGGLGLVDAHMQLAIQCAALQHHQQRGLHLALDLAGASDFEPAAAADLALEVARDRDILG
jgi:hypothetical protein